MKPDLEELRAKEIHSTEADDIIKNNHYLESTPAGAKHRYLIVAPMKGVFGAAMWGRPVARHEDQEDTLELTRFWTSDVTPKNTESKVLGEMMRDLKEKGYDRLIAYASTGQGHEGTIYQATNWEKVKETREGDSWKSHGDDRKERDLSKKVKYEYEL